MIRKAHFSDIENLSQLFFKAVTSISSEYYNKEELQDWASCGLGKLKWEERLKVHDYFVYEVENRIVGFTALNSEGYINAMFVSPDFQKKGIAQSLLEFVVEKAADLSLLFLTADVSLAAKSLFIRNGFVVLKEKKAKANQLFLTNFLMQKKLY